ncbi:MAG: FHA domain-containing protein, partial [Chloroflexota bacterium]
HIDLTPFGAQDKGVSRLHVRISLHPGGVAIQDLGSTNGTFINEYRLLRFTRVNLQHGDALEIGQMKFKVSFLAPAGV